MEGQLHLPDCGGRENIHLCGPLRKVFNLSDVPIRIEGWFGQVNTWAPLIPHVGAASEHAPFAAALWLPKSTIIRSVSLVDGSALTVFGAVGNGMTAIQQEVPGLTS